MLKLLTDNDLYAIHCATLEVLQNTGIIANSDEHLRIFKDAGAVVNEKKRHVKLPAYLVEECVRKAPKSMILGGRNPEHDVHVKRGGLLARPSSGYTFLLDLDSGECRPSTVKDCETAVRVVDGLENMSYASTTLMPTDVPKNVTDVKAVAIALSNTEKHVFFSPLTYKTFRSCLSMSLAVRGEEEFRKRPLISTLVATTSPLNIPQEVLFQLVDCARYKVPVLFDSSPMVGVTGPGTLAGSLVLLNAENLTLNTFVQLVDPGTPILYKSIATRTNMRADLCPLYGCIETDLMSAGGVELAHYYGLPCETHGLMVNSKTHDEQTGFEKALGSILPALLDSEIISMAGTLEAGHTFSYDQLVLDDEFVAILRRMKKGITVNDDTLAVNIIDKVGPSGNYLGQRHTRDHYASEVQALQVLDTNSRNVWEQAGKKPVDRVAREIVRKLIQDHQPKKLEATAVSAIDKILSESQKGT